MRRDTVWLCGSTTHTAGRPSVSVSALAGTSTPGGADSRMRPVTVAPSRMASGGSMMPTLTWNVRVAESAWGAISRTRPVAFTCGSLLRAISTSGSRGPDSNELLRDVEDGVAAALTCELHNHLPGVDDFARLGADGGDGARGVGEQSRVALLFPRGPQLRLRGVDLGLGAQELLLGVVEIGARGPAVLEQFLLPREGEARLGQRRLERGEIGFRRSRRIVLDLGIEPSDDLAGLEHIAHMDRPFDHPPVEAKGETDLILRANLAGQGDDLAFRAMLDGDRPNRTRLGDRRGRFVAASDGCGNQGRCCNSRLKHWRRLSQER